MITWCSDLIGNVTFGRKTYAPEAFNNRQKYNNGDKSYNFFLHLKQTEI
jgi:hypothetical protein